MPYKKIFCFLVAFALVCGILILTGRGKKAESSGKSEKSSSTLPPLDRKRIAADEASGIKFSADKRTLVEYRSADFTYSIPDGVTAIGDEAFGEEFAGWIIVFIPQSVTEIGKKAFQGCKYVEVSPNNPRFFTDTSGALIDRKENKLLFLPASDVYTISGNITEIEDSILRKCKKINVSPDNPKFFIDASGALIDRKGNKLLYLPENFSGSYSIPAGVAKIGDEAFRDCSTLTGVTIPNSVTEIGNKAFWGCRNLTDVNIPNSVTEIGNEAFWQCKKIVVAPDNPRFFTDKSGVLLDRKDKKMLYIPDTLSGTYTIPDGVVKIDKGAFAGCRKLTHIIITDSVTEIGEWAFKETCWPFLPEIETGTSPDEIKFLPRNSIKITVTLSNPRLLTDKSGALIDLKKRKLLYVPIDISGAYTVSDGVIEISPGAFDGCENLTDVTIPDSVTKIGHSAFFGCSKLTGVNIQNRAAKIGIGAFHNCPCEKEVMLKFPDYGRLDSKGGGYSK